MSAGGVVMPPVGHADIRVRGFVDFWNFQLALNRFLPKDFPMNWKEFGPWLAQQAGNVLSAPVDRIRYEGLNVYLSSGKGEREAKLKNWALTVLNRFPGVKVVHKERKAKSPPSCPVCHEKIVCCPHCQASMAGTIEKGIDTAIVTDMVSLAWAASYDVAVLVSANRDFIPAVELLGSKGIKVINASFAPGGMELAMKCWGTIDLKGARIPSRQAEIQIASRLVL